MLGCPDSRGWTAKAKAEMILVFIVEMATTEFAAVVVTFMFLPALLFGIICGVCCLKSIIYYTVRCCGASKDI